MRISGVSLGAGAPRVGMRPGRTDALVRQLDSPVAAMRASPRRRAREFVLQGLYQRQLSGNAPRSDPRAARRSGGLREGGRGVLRRAVDGRHRRVRRARRRSLAQSRPARRRALADRARDPRHRRVGAPAPARDSLPRRDQRGDRAREVVRRHRRPQVRQRRARQAGDTLRAAEMEALRRGTGTA